MMEFVMTYWMSILLILITVFILTFAWKKGKKDEVKAMIYWFVAEAETRLGDKSGKYKYGLVIEKVYNVLPLIVRMLFSKKEIDDFIEAAVKELKEYLESGHDLEPNIKLYEID